MVWNRSGRLNKRGEGLIQIEMEQAGRRMYLSTHTYIKKGLFVGGMVSDKHPLSAGLNTALIQQQMDCERVELDYIRQGVKPSLLMVRDAIREKMAPGARLVDFIRQMMQTGDRKEHTVQGYMTLANSFERWHKGMLLTDVDYQQIQRYEQQLTDNGLAHNTIVGRLRQWRAVMSEAVRRRLLEQNPFRRLRHWAHGSQTRLSYHPPAITVRTAATVRAKTKSTRLLPILLLDRTTLQRPHNIAA